MPEPESPTKRTPKLRLPGGWLTAAIPLLWLVGLGAWVVARWSHLPRMIPIHWGLNGLADYWVRRTPSAVLTVMGTMGAICLAFIALAWLMLQQPPQTASPESMAAERTFRRQAATLIVASAWFLAFSPGFSLLPLPAGSFRIWMVLFAATLLTGVIALVRSGLRMRRPRLPGTLEHLESRAQDDRWRGPFFFDRRNPSLFVPKRFGHGYTLNFANPWAWILVALTVAVLLFLPALLHR